MTTAERAAKIRALIEELLTDDPPPQQPLAPEGPLLLTIDETAETLRISRTGVKRALATGELQAIRIGRLVRIPRESIDAFVAGRLQ